MSTPAARARAEQLAKDFCIYPCVDGCDPAYCEDSNAFAKAVTAILAYADEVRREERATLQAAITQSAREIRRLEKKLVERESCPCEIRNALANASSRSGRGD